MLPNMKSHSLLSFSHETCSSAQRAHWIFTHGHLKLLCVLPEVNNFLSQFKLNHPPDCFLKANETVEICMQYWSSILCNIISHNILIHLKTMFKNTFFLHLFFSPNNLHFDFHELNLKWPFSWLYDWFQDLQSPNYPHKSGIIMEQSRPRHLQFLGNSRPWKLLERRRPWQNKG